MKHYGDITKINGAEAPVVDIITGGSPCQDLSVARKRAGLAGERSGLFMEQIRIVKEMRERERATGRTGWMVRPRYMVWENVPGAFSSGNPKGADFAAVIEEIIKVAEPGAAVSVCVPNGGWTKSGCYYAEDGSWSVAWRVHDAQFWGVPQRRKRIALVADFGGLSAPEILFERKGLSGDSEPCGAQGEETAGAVGKSVEGASCYGLDHVMLSGGTTYQGRGYYDNVSGCLKTQPHGVCETISFQERGGKPGGGKGILIQHEHIGAPSTLNNQSVLQVGCDVYNQEITGDVAASLTAASGGTNTSGPKVFCLQGNVIDRAETARCNGEGWREDQCYTLNTIDRPAVAFAQNQRNEVRDLGDIAGALAAEPGMKQQTFVYDARGNGDGKTVCTITGDHQNRVTDYTALCVGNGQANQSVSDKAGALNTMHDQQAVLVPDVAHALKAKANCDFRADSETYPVQNSVVRRLTPLECERLQGYPDGWTDIGEWVDSKGKKHKDADSPRYKALGNSIALPFWQWMARRICAQYERPVTMASLFDGIGGFPLVFQRCGAVPVWASEIEEFPIAVTKARFPDESIRHLQEPRQYQLRTILQTDRGFYKPILIKQREGTFRYPLFIFYFHHSKYGRYSSGICSIGRISIPL